MLGSPETPPVLLAKETDVRSFGRGMTGAGSPNRVEPVAEYGLVHAGVCRNESISSSEDVCSTQTTAARGDEEAAAAIHFT